MHPVLFSLGETPIHAYGFLIAVALILGWIMSLAFARADKLPADQLGTGYVIAVGAGLLAGRAMWLFSNREQFDGLVSLIQLQAGGLSGFGGVLTGLIVAGVYCQNKKIPPWAWLDCAAPAFLLGVVLERLGAFLAGADFGAYVDPDFFLAVQFPADSPVYDVQRRELTGLRIGLDRSLTVHPSQLYAAGAAALGVGLSLLIRARRQYSGQVALFAMGYYAAIRYLIEDPFRYDVTPELAGPVTLGHLTGVVVIAVVIGVHIMRRTKLAEAPASVIQWTGGPWTPGAEDAAKSGKKKSGKKKSGKKKSAKKSGATSSKSGEDAKPKGEDAKPD
ncbi:prolipoprotein diacylglyceryl transferase [Enhygromyxa salina]|uniref:Prolipoprotein diacylglyceryl transferase n=1 Tax=Enhygromyxa salina TaxID=215803 RepID=A0A2S9YQ83_9BACT|nr:prolipoprotein diacylglyceryl transferase family protein [Enhygromyxa salina]PRQ07253.1 Prolipoprotein diacylglyceryl transferase [Enhygromyxa salina]